MAVTSRGGEALGGATPRIVRQRSDAAFAKTQKTPGKKKKTGRRTIDVRPMTDPAYDDAFNLFRHTMSTLKQFTPQVNTGLISQPYTDAQTAATSMGQGLARDTNAQTQQSLAQYGQALNARAANTSTFAAAAGAPAAPTIEDRGTSMLAAQGQTNADAALQAAPAYNQLLERAKANAIAKATLGRDDLVSQGIASAATQLPGLTQQNRQRSFAESTADQNYLLALGTQKDKATEQYRQFLLDKIKVGQTGAYQAGLLDQGQQRINQGERKLQAQTKLWNAQVKKAQQVAKTFKLNGVSQALGVMKPKSSGGGQTQQGWTVTYTGWDPDTGAYDSPHTVRGVEENWDPGSDNKIISKQPNMVDSAGSSSGFSWARYKQARGILTANNPGITPAQIRSILGPTPKTGKKKKP